MSIAMTTPLIELETELNQMILDGKILEAFEKFYADDCTMQDGPDVTVGKEANFDREKMFVDGLTEVRGVELNDVAVGEDVTMSTWHFDYTHEAWGAHTYDQVAVRRWANGQIVSERFYKAA